MADKLSRKQVSAEAFAEMLDPKKFPKDLAAILIWLVLAILAIYIPGVNESFVRVVFAIPVILFIPGYAFVAALFPEKYEKAMGYDEGMELISDEAEVAEARAMPRRKGSGIGGIERFALSVGLSIAVVPLIGFVLNYTPYGIRLEPILVSLTVFTVVMVLIALFRRAVLPEGKRFCVGFERVVPLVKEELFPAKGQKKLDKVLSVVLIVAVAAAVVVAVFVIAFPLDGERFTEFYILGHDKMAEKYPERFAAGSEQFVWVGIGNHEYRNITYTVETLLLNVEWDNATNSSVIHAWMPLDRYEVAVADKTTSLERYNFTVTDTGYNRLEFLLYNETVPPVGASAQEKMDVAYRDLHLWIKVT